MVSKAMQSGKLQMKFNEYVEFIHVSSKCQGVVLKEKIDVHEFCTEVILLK